jgi:ATP-binding cassette, subfamily B, bacterial MsbA
LNERLRAAILVSPDAGRIYRRLLRYAAPHWGMFGIGVLGMALFAATDASTAWLVREFLNTTFVEHNPRALWFIPVAIVVLFFLRGVGDYVATYFPGWVGRQIIKAMRAELFAHYLRLPARYYDAASSAQMLSRLTYNIELVAEAATNSVTVLIRDTLTILALLGWLFYLNWRLTLIALTLAPLIAWLLQRVNRLFRRYSARIQNSMADVTRVAKEAIEAHRVIRVFNAHDYEQRAFDVVNEQNRHSNMRLIGAKASSNPVVQLIAAVGLAAVMYFAISQVLTHEMRVGDFLSFLTGLLLISAPLRRLIQVFVPLQQGIAAGASVFEVLDEPLEDVGGTRALGRARGDVEYRDVNFEYVTEKGPVLRGVSLRAPAGTTVAIVGKSGSGKSTLVALLPRFYDPQQGGVWLDGVNVREYRLADLRRQVSLVSQDVVLFNDSIRNNIAFSTLAASTQAVENAARAAYVLEFTDELPDGLDTLVGDRGALLSGGQRQRIAIARAILKDAPVLILDEATSSLDTDSERRIQAALAQLARNRTTLVIAHRLSTVEQADRIVVLDDGAVVETGTHAELLAHGGLYAQLYRLQFSA